MINYCSVKRNTGRTMTENSLKIVLFNEHFVQLIHLSNVYNIYLQRFVIKITKQSESKDSILLNKKSWKA